jgi:hypothetical protein
MAGNCQVVTMVLPMFSIPFFPVSDSLKDVSRVSFFGKIDTVCFANPVAEDFDEQLLFIRPLVLISGCKIGSGENHCKVITTAISP